MGLFALVLVLVSICPQVTATQTLVLVNMAKHINMLTSPYFAHCTGYCSINKTNHTNFWPGAGFYDDFKVNRQDDLQNKVWPINPKFIGIIDDDQTTDTTVVDIDLLFTGYANINPFYGIGMAVNWTKTGNVDRNGHPKFLFYFKRVDLGNTSLLQICLYDCFE